ncbi:hypothetical protein KFE94_14320 [bacterium SCSIO 12643]|nr:hypothetical protein KFE94_14320 [bacterium SCSIO 12643]
MQLSKVIIASLDTGFIRGIENILQDEEMWVIQVKTEAEFLQELPSCSIALVDVSYFIHFISPRKLSIHEKVICIYDHYPYKTNPISEIYFNKNDSADQVIQQIQKCLDRQKNGRNLQGFAIKYRMTRRELELFELIVKGYKSKQIAEQLNISVRTVEGHRSSILQKTNCKSTRELLQLFEAHS